MNDITMNAHMAEYVRLTIMAKELDKLIAAEKLAITEYMQDNGLQELYTADHMATYKPVSTPRIDSKALKAALPEVAAQYTTLGVAYRLNVK